MLVQRRPEYHACWGPVRMAVEVDQPMPAAVVEMPVEPKPDGKLEDRNGFEAEPPPRFQGMPKCKQAGGNSWMS